MGIILSCVVPGFTCVTHNTTAEGRECALEMKLFEKTLQLRSWGCSVSLRSLALGKPCPEQPYGEAWWGGLRLLPQASERSWKAEPPTSTPRQTQWPWPQLTPGLQPVRDPEQESLSQAF